MMVDSFNLTLFKNLTSSSALIFHQLHDHEQKVARFHLKELLGEGEEGIHDGDEGTRVDEGTHGVEDGAYGEEGTHGSSWADSQLDSKEVDFWPASSVQEENLVSIEKQIAEEDDLKRGEQELNTSAKKDLQASLEENSDPMQMEKHPIPDKPRQGAFTELHLANRTSVVEPNVRTKLTSESESKVLEMKNLEKVDDRDIPHWVAACSMPEILDPISSKFIP